MHIITCSPSRSIAKAKNSIIIQVDDVKSSRATNAKPGKVIFGAQITNESFSSNATSKISFLYFIADKIELNARMLLVYTWVFQFGIFSIFQHFYQLQTIKGARDSLFLRGWAGRGKSKNLREKKRFFAQKFSALP